MGANDFERKSRPATSNHDYEYVFDLYRLYRGQEEHENLLINNRLTSFLTLQSVLLATFGFSFQKYYEIAERINEKMPPDSISVLKASMESLNSRYFIFLSILCIIGVICSEVARRSLVAAVGAQKAIREKWETTKLRLDLPQIADLPPFAGGGNMQIVHLGRTFSTSLPLIFNVLWISVVMLVILSYIFHVNIQYGFL
jgi:hypothetical protein